jgi:hypothetical protein
MDQKDEQIEHIARTFYAAREAGVWENASRTLKHDFRLYARQAIAMLEKQHEKTWAHASAMMQNKSLEAA